MPLKFFPGTSKQSLSIRVDSLLYLKLDSKDKGSRKHRKDWHLPNPSLSWNRLILFYWRSDWPAYNSPPMDRHRWRFLVSSVRRGERDSWSRFGRRDCSSQCWNFLQPFPWNPLNGSGYWHFSWKEKGLRTHSPQLSPTDFLWLPGRLLDSRRLSVWLTW